MDLPRVVQKDGPWIRKGKKVLPGPRGEKLCTVSAGFDFWRKDLPSWKVSDGLLQTLFVTGDELVPDNILFGINQFSAGCGIEPGERLPNALRKARGGDVIWDEALDLAVIEYHAYRLVANQSAFHFRQARHHEVRRNMHDPSSTPTASATVP